MERDISSKAIGFVVVAVIVLIILASTCGMVNVSGSELAVKETVSGGLSDQIYPPGTYFPFRWNTKYYVYDMTTKVFVMNEDPESDQTNGRDYDPYLVQSADQQDMHISFSIRWRFDPTKILDIHKNYHAHTDSEPGIIEERLLRNDAQRIVKNHATKMKAAEAYSGTGLVQLQTEIETDLASPNSDLYAQGIIVENFVIEKIVLDPEYVKEIRMRQLATQQTLRAAEEARAAEAMALAAKAKAQTALNEQVVAAEAAKQVAVLKAEQLAESEIVAAQAEAKKVELAAAAEAARLITAANARRQSAEAEAAAVLAAGKAAAEARRLEFSAYADPGAQTYAMIECSKNMAAAFSGVSGYLPPGINITSLSSDYLTAVRQFMGPVKTVETIK